MQRLLSKYANTTTARGRAVECDYDATERRLTLWWVTQNGRRHIDPITVVMKPTDGHFRVATYVGVDAPSYSGELTLADACAAIDQELARY